MSLFTNFLVKGLFPSAICKIVTNEPVLYLTFDDGPIPEVTPSVLELLKKYNAKATFFCIGENVIKHPDVFQRILSAGHTAGNHTFNHLNGWKTKTTYYLQNISLCDSAINSSIQNFNPKPLFRPPYGKITPSQISKIKQQYSIILWDILSNDWKQNLPGSDCFERIKKRARPGSIIVFHDSLKAAERMIPALKMTLDYFSAKGYCFKAITQKEMLFV